MNHSTLLKPSFALVFLTFCLIVVSTAQAQNSNSSLSGVGAPTPSGSNSSLSGTGAPTGSNSSLSGTGAPASGNQSTFTLSNPLSSKFNSVGTLVQGFVQIFSYIVVIAAVLMIIWVGLQFIFAQGKPERMKELSRWLGYIVIGVAIVIGARIIINIVINTLAASGANSNLIQSAQNAANGR
ncbi:MAG: TrbC/VirB2 family protein [Patescibacteria group bacterium]|nr:TrbC/VirB2 family protein [Patescibacteria group bacterium]